MTDLAGRRLLAALADGPLSTWEAGRNAGVDKRTAGTRLAAFAAAGLVRRHFLGWELTGAGRARLADLSREDAA